ncbi:SCP2 sterol-binding domain containing protein [Russula decolorans]
MSDVKEDGYKASEVLAALAAVFGKYSKEEREAQTKKNNAIFELKVKNAAGKETIWTIDLKSAALVKKATAKSLDLKQDVTVILSDETFMDIAEGKTSGQTAFMTGRLKAKGNMMLAMKLNDILQSTKEKAKL